MVTMSTSHIVKEEMMGVAYMDTMMPLVGWVTLSGPWTGGLNPGAYHTGHHRPHAVSELMTTFGWRGELMTIFEWRSVLITTFGQKG